MWIPGHTGIPEYEAADIVGKYSLDLEINTTFKTINELAKLGKNGLNERESNESRKAQHSKQYQLVESVTSEANNYIKTIFHVKCTVGHLSHTCWLRKISWRDPSGILSFKDEVEILPRKQ
jgi:hypothetical protein